MWSVVYVEVGRSRVRAALCTDDWRHLPCPRRSSTCAGVLDQQQHDTLHRCSVLAAAHHVQGQVTGIPAYYTTHCPPLPLPLTGTRRSTTSPAILWPTSLLRLLRMGLPPRPTHSRPDTLHLHQILHLWRSSLCRRTSKFTCSGASEPYSVFLPPCTHTFDFDPTTHCHGTCSEKR